MMANCSAPHLMDSERRYDAHESTDIVADELASRVAMALTCHAAPNMMRVRKTGTSGQPVGRIWRWRYHSGRLARQSSP